jgi:hypothetical protein
MKQMSAAQLKRTRRGRPPDALPKEGSEIRRLYDYFYQNRGIPVPYLHVTHNHGTQLRQLTVIYGLDIRRVSKGMYCLCGEWNQRGVYIDYVAERLKLEDQ